MNPSSFWLWATKRKVYLCLTNTHMKEPKMELTPYQRRIETMMHAIIILTLLGIFLKVLIL